MGRTRVVTRRVAPAEDDLTDGHPDQVNVDIAAPHAVYWDGEQRTGTIHNVPRPRAVYWLRHGWASCIWWP